jgi:hypothetical protein
VDPSVDPDPAALDRAVGEGDYAGFRRAAFGYEEPVRRRVGRWVERYPKIAARIDRGLKIEDIVEAVFLDAFEGYDQRPREASPAGSNATRARSAAASAAPAWGASPRRPRSAQQRHVLGRPPGRRRQAPRVAPAVQVGVGRAPGGLGVAEPPGPDPSRGFG